VPEAEQGRGGGEGPGQVVDVQGQPAYAAPFGSAPA
jgi:hypothetical protein